MFEHDLVANPEDRFSPNKAHIYIFFQIFDCKRMKFAEIPGKLHSLLMPPDPIVINHIITVEGPDARKTACYDIDVEVVSYYIDIYLTLKLHSVLNPLPQ